MLTTTRWTSSATSRRRRRSCTASAAGRAWRWGRRGRSCAPRAGAVPLYTDDDAQAETIGASRAGLGLGGARLHALAAALLFALQARLSAQGNVPGSWACLAACAVFAAGFVFSFFPFVGYTRSLRKIHAEQEADPRR